MKRARCVLTKNMLAFTSLYHIIIILYGVKIRTTLTFFWVCVSFVFSFLPPSCSLSLSPPIHFSSFHYLFFTFFDSPFCVFFIFYHFLVYSISVNYVWARERESPLYSSPSKFSAKSLLPSTFRVYVYARTIDKML